MAERNGTETTSAAEVRQRAIMAALELAAERGWRAVSMADIAERAGLKLLDLHGEFATKGSVLDGFATLIDSEVLAEIDPGSDAGESPRDRLFDVLMRRFDALEPFKPGLKGIAGEARRDPVAAVCTACDAGPTVMRSMRWMLEAAGLSGAGPVGRIRIKVLAGAYVATLRVWLEDDSPDLGRTMASLDGYLRRLEEFASGLGAFGRRFGKDDLDVDRWGAEPA